MHITSQRRLWFTFSGIAVVVSLALSLVFGFNLGLDFTGGARWQIEFQETNALDEALTEPADMPLVTQDQLASFFAGRSELTQDAQIQSSEANTFLITLEDLEDSQLQALKADLADQVAPYEEISYRKVDSSIGQSFQRKSFWAIIAALTGIIIFVALAFRKVPKSISPWRFGAVAIAALFHDILIILGVFALLSLFTPLELDLQFITALLATLGFSVNDTIVILDRVRENLDRQKSTETFEDTVESAIQQTMRRSVYTSVSTLLPLLGLLFFGASSLFYFVLALVLGIAVGTYSSIFLAAPLLVSLKR